jgi:molybdopterin converting factor small subunit
LATAGQARTDTAAPFEFHVPLADAETTDAPAAVEETGRDAATDAEPTAEQTEAPEHIERVEPEDGDTSETLRAKYNAQYSRKLEADRKRIREELLAELRAKQPEAPEAAQAAPAERQAEAGDPFDELYRVDMDSFKPTLKFAEDSPLAEFADELSAAFTDALKQGIQHTLKGIQSNDKSFRERQTAAQREQEVGQTISGFLESVKDHPEFADVWPELQKFGQKTRGFAMEDPKEWIETVRLKWPQLDPDWRGAAEAEQAQAGQINRKLATRTHAQVQRPTRTVAATGGGIRSFDAELEAQLKRAGY